MYMPNNDYSKPFIFSLFFFPFLYLKKQCKLLSSLTLSYNFKWKYSTNNIPFSSTTSSFVLFCIKQQIAASSPQHRRTFIILQKGELCIQVLQCSQWHISYSSFSHINGWLWQEIKQDLLLPAKTLKGKVSTHWLPKI